MADITRDLIEYMQGLDIIDCHEHLMPERARVELSVDVLLLFSLYPQFALQAAGYPASPSGKDIAPHFVNSEAPLSERWREVWPHLKQVRYQSCFRPGLIALRDLYGIDELSDATYEEASARIRAANQPGLYTRILREKCRIQKCLVVNAQTFAGPDPPDIFRGLYEERSVFTFERAGFLEELAEEHGARITNLDDYFDVLAVHLKKVKEERGAVGYKTFAYALPEPDLAAARVDFAGVLNGQPATPILLSTARDHLFKCAGELDWPVAVHTGHTHDYRKLDPKHMIDLLVRHPNVRFDLFHLGQPFVRDCIFIARNFPNAYLNLCWCYVVSQESTRQAINEILDVVAVNKVFAFGGDYVWDVESVYGHLVMARETMAEALADRIARGQLDVEGAREVIRLWFHDNPVAFYGLNGTAYGAGSQ